MSGDPASVEELAKTGGPVAGLIGIAFALVSKMFIGKATDEMKADLKELLKSNQHQEVQLGNIEIRVGTVEKVIDRDAGRHDDLVREMQTIRNNVDALHKRVDALSERMQRP